MSDSEEKVTDNTFSFPKAEEEILGYWKKNNIFKKCIEQNKNNKHYIFYDGPPFATGLPHHGHLLASTLKDIVPRYFNMKGFNVQRRFGWDCHGLPVEHEIDKLLNMSSQEAVKELGIKGYNDKCRSIVHRFTKEWRNTIERIGRWVDFDNDYKTMDPWYMESVWWVFKQLWEKDLIYLGEKVVPFSTELGTVLSNFEAGSNYKDVQDPAITVLFKLLDENAYVAAWTTTPWTLPSNIALCVGENIDYVKVKDKERNIRFYIAKERLEAIGKNKKIEVIGEYNGNYLVGKHYEPLFPYFSFLSDTGAFRILSDDYVTSDSGTGVVHQAPAFGEDDFRVIKKAGIDAFVCPIDMSGRFTEEVSDFKGLHVKDADKKIIMHLKESGSLYIQDVIVHSYPFCPRSDTPIIYRTIPSWYVKVEKVKDDLLKANQKINWVPEHIKNGRMGNWLKGASDWAISRNRYWGTPLPLWFNEETSRYICIGSVEELAEYAGVRVSDLHRENVDNLTFSLKNEKGIYKRVEEVLDCWFESGSMPYAQLHYPFENKDIFKSGFPAEYIAEGLDQTRGWFYTLNVIAVCLYNRPAFKNVIVNGIVVAEDGKKMSKRLRNYTPPDELIDKFGADALRLYLIKSGLVKAEEQRFSDEDVKEMVRRALLPWLNSFKFIKTYIEIDEWKCHENPTTSTNILDQWILSKLQSLKESVINEMDNYRLYNVIPELFNFIEDLTNWYIRLNRSRFWSERVNADKDFAYCTLYSTLHQINLIMAPFAPFLSEYLFLELAKFNPKGKENESVHLCSYPCADKSLINLPLESAVRIMQSVILLGRQKRNQVKIKLKTPLRSLIIVHENKDLISDVSGLEYYIKKELNVKTISYSSDETKYIDFYAKPNSPVLGKRLGKSFKKYKSLIESLPPERISELIKYESITIEDETFSISEIFVFKEPKPGIESMSDGFISIVLDCSLDNELISEGYAREVINNVNNTRKKLGFNVADRVAVHYTANEKIACAIDSHKNYISKETLSMMFEKDNRINDGHSFKIDGEILQLKIEKVG